MGMHIGTNWRIQLNRPCAAAMRPYITLTTCLCYFVSHFVFRMNVCFCCVRLSFFSTIAKRLAGKNVSEMTYLCRVRRKTLTSKADSAGGGAGSSRGGRPPSVSAGKWKCKICARLDSTLSGKHKSQLSPTEPRVTLCVTATVLQTKLDAQCDKLAMIDASTVELS